MKPRTGWSSVLLVGLMMLTVAWSIGAAQPAPGVGILTPVVIGGVMLGAVLGSQLWMPAGLAHGWSMVLGLLTTVFFAAGSLTEFPSAPGEAIAELGRFERMELVRDWYLAWIEVQRGQTDISALSGLVPGDSSDLAYLFFAVTMALLLWLLAYICTWFIVRYLSWWGAVLPSGFALVFNLTNTRMQDAFLLYLSFFLLCAFLLASQTFLAMQMRDWRREHVGYGMDLGFDLLRDGLVLSVLALALAWLLPSELDRGELQQAARRLAREPQSRISRQMQQWFPNLSYPVRGGGNTFGQEMGLGGSIELGNEPIFDVRVEGDVLPRYWRQAVYDRYDGSGWQRGAEDRREAGADQPWRSQVAPAQPVTQTVTTIHTSTSQLYAAPQPQRFSIPVRAELAGGGMDALTFESLEALPPGSEYQVVSLMPSVDLGSLRQASSEDPDWVRERYLQLPDTITERTRALANDLTAGQTNRLERVQSLERYLRQIPYEEQIGSPPEGQDRVDWFLFDERQGYCDYYSSSFVVMARSIGIPARVAAGYSRGSLVGDSQVWRHRASDAHTWPEVYFPDHGWIEFEPTAADAPIARPAGLEAENPAADGPLPGELGEDMLPDERSLEDLVPQRDPGAAGALEPAGSEGPRLPVLPLLATLAALASAAGLGWLVFERPLRGLSPAAGNFARLARLGRWLGIGPRPADTPNEYGRRVASIIPEGAGEVETIVQGYVGERFGRRASQAEGQRLEQAWKRLRAQLSRAAARLGWARIKR